MKAAALTFAMGVDATLEEGNDVMCALITTDTLPLRANNIERIKNLPFCAARVVESDNADQFPRTNFCTKLRTSTAFGKNIWKAWTGTTVNAWRHHAYTNRAQMEKGVNVGRKESMLNIRAWLARRRSAEADKWDWSKATDVMVREAGWMRVPHRDAPSFRELRKGGCENRYLAIVRQTLPAITTSGRVHDSRDGWIDSSVVGAGDKPCKTPGVRTFLALAECCAHVMATDILGDGMLYVLVPEIQVLPRCRPCPEKQSSTGAIFYEEGFVIITCKSNRLTCA
jgi:hypothetical protein